MLAGGLRIAFPDRRGGAGCDCWLVAVDARVLIAAAGKVGKTFAVIVVSSIASGHGVAPGSLLVKVT